MITYLKPSALGMNRLGFGGSLWQRGTFTGRGLFLGAEKKKAWFSQATYKTPFFFCGYERNLWSNVTEVTSILLLQGGQSAQTNTSNGYYVTTWKTVYCVTLLHTSQIQIIWIYISKLLCATLKRQKRGCNIRQLARFFFFCFCFLSSFKSGNVCRANMLFFSNTLLHCHSSTLSYLPGGSTAFCYWPLSSSMELLTRGWVTRGGYTN